MFARSYRLLALLGIVALAACGSDGGTSPNAGLNVGQSLKVTGAQDVKLEGGSSGASYYVVLANNGTAVGAQQSFTLTANGVSGSASALIPQDNSSLTLNPFGAPSDARVVNTAFEARLRSQERTVLTSRIPGARAWRAAWPSSSSSTTTNGSF